MVRNKNPNKELVQPKIIHIYDNNSFLLYILRNFLRGVGILMKLRMTWLQQISIYASILMNLV
ncbi:hypothetical protein Fmac_003035 [Flemingia macrophylla]|uniref:Uncharacterized protein n=1 Tax=Flemingia macrophylla TaxID=520843 RepID=A0ABD1NLL8_9FABA